MLKPNLTKPLAFLLAGGTLFLPLSQVVFAQSPPRGELYVPYTQSNGALLPDWERITFRLIRAVQRGGSLDLSGLAGVLGYDPSRSWSAGDAITSILLLGDLADATNPTDSLSRRDFGGCGTVGGVFPAG
jgi:hypothetical protein